MTAHDRMRIAVIVPTYGRPELVERTVARLAGQTRRPDAILISAPDASHVGLIANDALPVRLVDGSHGLAAQRNAALRALDSDIAIVVFFDDDFLPADDYLENVAAVFSADPGCAVLTGDVLADGINSRGIGFEDAERSLLASAAVPPGAGRGAEYHAGYGCNMALRRAAIGTLRFDERLVLYGWQEDVDFTRRVAAASGGRIVKHTALRGVHMGVKSGRTSGVRLGYSQIVNPVYLLRKGSMTPRLALRLMARNVAANAGRALWAEPWIDRRGRLKGNLIGLAHVLAGRIEPEHARELG